MKINWGIKIAILYSGFVVLIVTLVTMSMHQHFDLVAADYYNQEVAYQDVIDAGRNQSALSAPIAVHADGSNVEIALPQDIAHAAGMASIQFYSPVNSAWDRRFNETISGGNITIPRARLINTRYIIKIDLAAGGKKYYQESEITLHKS